MHYRRVLATFHQVPVTMLVGPPNTNKTFLARIAAALLGLHRNSMFQDLSLARASELLGKTLFFVYNDPDKVDVLKGIIGKSFEEGITSNFVRERHPNTTPLVTANAFLMSALRTHGMRETSRVNIIPLKEETSRNECNIDELLNGAGGDISRLITLGDDITSERAIRDVHTISRRIVKRLPKGSEAAERIAKNYAMLMHATCIFVRDFDTGLEQGHVWGYFVDVILPCGILSHQLTCESETESRLLNGIIQVCRQVDSAEAQGIIALSQHRFGGTKLEPALTVRMRKLLTVMRARQSVITWKESELRKEVAVLGGKTGSCKFQGEVVSATSIPCREIPENIMKVIRKSLQQDKSTVESVGEESGGSESAGSESGGSESVGDDSARDDSEGDDTEGDDTEGDDSARDNSARDDSVRDDSEGDDSAQDDSEGDDSVRDDSASAGSEVHNTGTPTPVVKAKVMGSPMTQLATAFSATLVKGDIRGTIEMARGRPRRARKRLNKSKAFLDTGEERCAVCGRKYSKRDGENRPWIACNRCDAWYHHDCDGLSRVQFDNIGDDEQYICTHKCQNKQLS